MEIECAWLKLFAVCCWHRKPGVREPPPPTQHYHIYMKDAGPNPILVILYGKRNQNDHNNDNKTNWKLRRRGQQEHGYLHEECYKGSACSIVRWNLRSDLFVISRLIRYNKRERLWWTLNDVACVGGGRGVVSEKAPQCSTCCTRPEYVHSLRPGTVDLAGSW